MTDALNIITSKFIEPVIGKMSVIKPHRYITYKQFKELYGAYSWFKMEDNDLIGIFDTVTPEIREKQLRENSEIYCDDKLISTIGEGVKIPEITLEEKAYYVGMSIDDYLWMLENK